MQKVKLSNGVEIPIVGFGCAAIGEFQESSSMVTEVMTEAIEAGYRHFDTATIYNTESNVAEAISQSGLSREEFFITTKVQKSELGYDETLKACERSLKELKVDVIDLYLVHWPIKESFLEAWRALERLYEEGVVRAIGGSNFAQRHIEAVEAKGNFPLMMNQVELHPFYSQPGLRQFCEARKIAVTAWSPLGTGSWSDVTEEMKPLADPVIRRVAQEVKRTEAQVILRWMVQHQIVTIPKSQSKERIKENISLFDFELSESQVKKIDGVNRDYSLSLEHSVNRDLYDKL